MMKAPQRLHELGQSLWLDNITRDLLDRGTLKRYIDELSVTGLTSNPTIFDHAIKNSAAYDAAIRTKLRNGISAEALFFELALDDLGRAADLFRPIHDRTDGVDGWVSLEVSPLLAYDTASTLAAAKALFGRAKLRNLLIKIPGTRQGLPAIEEAIFAGVSVNVTLLFSREHYVAAAEAYLRGIERRIAIGLNPNVGSVASVFVSRWDAAVTDTVPAALRNQLGIAIAKRTYASYRTLLDSPRWQRVDNARARAHRPQSQRPIRRPGLRQPLGRRRHRHGAGGAAQSARHCDREADVRVVSHAARLAALAARRKRRRAPATPALGEHGNQGSQRVRRPLYQGARRAVHGEHHAREHLEGAGRSRRDRRVVAPGWRRWRGPAGPFRRGRYRRGRPRDAAPGRRRQGVRELVERPHAGDCRQARRPRQGELTCTRPGRPSPLTTTGSGICICASSLRTIPHAANA